MRRHSRASYVMCASVPSALLSVIFGLRWWSIAELVAPQATVPPQMVGLGFSLLGMVLGSLVPGK
jgi:hypothetical protein